jgi:hypothetical protein
VRRFVIDWLDHSCAAQIANERPGAADSILCRTTAGLRALTPRQVLAESTNRGVINATKAAALEFDEASEVSR